MSECLFCGIVQRKVPAEIVAEGTDVLAFKDINPQAPTHLLIVPKTHLATLSEVTDSTAGVLVQTVLMANRLAQEWGIAQTGYRLVFNCGTQAGQSVFHLHAHLLGGRPMRWPPG